MRALIAAGLLMWTSENVQAQIYEWYDEQGRRHFSDQEPVGITYRIVGVEDESRLSTYTPDPIDRPQAAGTGSEPSSARAPARETDPADNTAAAELAEACSGYLERLDAIQDQLRAGYSEPRGNRLRARRQALQTAYRRDCT